MPLKIQFLSKKYGDLKAVDNISLDIEDGEIFGLLGPNGAGKTSIISIISTLEKPTDGKVLVFGHDVTKEPKVTKSLIGLVPQELIHHAFFTVEEILKFHSGYFGIYPNSEHIEFLLEKLNLLEHRKKRVKQLSGGMKRRLLIAKALVHKPRLLILDEPTAGVDVQLRNSLWTFVRELKKMGVTILLTTHYLEEAQALCDRVGFIDKGKLLLVGKTGELITNLSQRKAIFTLKSPLAPIKHQHLHLQTDTHLHFHLHPSKTIADLLHELSLNLDHLNDMNIQEGSLDDAFKKILRGDYAT